MHRIAASALAWSCRVAQAMVSTDCGINVLHPPPHCRDISLRRHHGLDRVDDGAQPCVELDSVRHARAEGLSEILAVRSNWDRSVDFVPCMSDPNLGPYLTCSPRGVLRDNGTTGV